MIEDHLIASDSHRDFAGLETSSAQRQASRFWSHLGSKLRGRYLFLGSVMLAVGAVGATAGWLHGHRLYRGEGMVLLATDLPTVADALRASPPDRERFANAEVVLMSDPSLIEAAMRSAAWQDIVHSKKPVTVGAFASALTAERLLGEQTIHVYFAFPDAMVASAGIRAILGAYEANSRERQTKLIAALQSERTQLMADINSLDEQLDQVVARNGSDNLEIVENAKLQTWQDCERKSAELNAVLTLVSGSRPPGEILAQLTPLQISMVDGTMSGLLDTLDADELQLQQRYVSLGPYHPLVNDARVALEGARKRVDDYALWFHTLQIKSRNVVDALVQKAGEIREKQKHFEELGKQTKAEWVELGHARLQVDKIKERRGILGTQLAEIDRQIRAFSGALYTINYGDSPAPVFKDNRLTWAMLAAGGGMFVTFMVLASMALRDNRYRYSDEAEETEAGRPRLLGILPVIPADFSNPDQAAIVAHCVHQIRVMLQLENGPTKSKCYMVTSGTAGDGKTSLTVALGISFASSGARTLLIDGDMIGQALSHRMAAATRPASAPPESTGGLGQTVQSTGIPNLSILPLPADTAGDAGGLSPKSIKHLLDQMRDQFDAILIDTGPVLGSIEASIIAGAVDGVILAISRGQQRALVNRALRHLSASGANILGMVFNRAERRDFHRSVVSTSLRSISATPTTPRLLPTYSPEVSRLGPLAACVTSSRHHADAR